MNSESPTPKPFNLSNESSQEGVNFLKLFYLMLSNWHWFAFSVIAIFLIAWIYIRYTPPIWRVSATILIEEEYQDNAAVETDQLLQGFGLRPGMQNLDNQLHILTSWSSINRTLDDLPFDIEVYYKGLLNKVALYPESPIVVYTDTDGTIPEDVDFKLKILDKSTFKLSAKSKNSFKLKTVATFGETIELLLRKKRVG